MDFFSGTDQAFSVEIFAHGEELMVQGDFDGADVSAGPAEAAGKRKRAVLFGGLKRCEDGADGAGHGGLVAMSATAAVDGAGVHAGTATDTVEAAAEFGFEDFGAAVVDDHDVQFAALLWSVEVRRISGDGLAGSGSCEEAEKDGQVCGAGDEFFHAHAGDVDFGESDAEICVAFVCADDETAGFGDGKVNAGESCVGVAEALAKVIACGFGEVFGVRGALFSAEVFVEAFSDLFLADVDGGEDDVTGRFFAELDDAFAEVSVDDLDSVVFEERIEMAFFGEHGLAFHKSVHVVGLQDGEDDTIMFFGVGGPVNDGTECSGAGFELFEVVGHLRLSVSFDCGRSFSEEFPLGDAGGHAVSFFTNKPESAVVPAGAIAVGSEGFGKGRMGHRRSPVVVRLGGAIGDLRKRRFSTCGSEGG